MKSAAKFAIVLITAPDLKTARTLAKASLKARLIACASLVPQLESHYWWQGKMESGAEVLMIMKTDESETGRAGEMDSRPASLRNAGVSGAAVGRGQ